MKPVIEINGRRIGAGLPAYIVAEMSANHGHDYAVAVEILRAAKAAGADAVKLQTYTPDTMTIDSDAPPFVIRGTAWHGRKLYDLYGEAYTPWEWQPKLKRVADELGLDLFSTPFDETAVDFLSEMGVPAFKVASFELVDQPLLQKIARTGKPVILSTGMATLAEIEEAVRVVRDAGANDLVLLRCTSEYPARPADMHLRTIGDLQERFDVPIGLSDHTLDVAIPAAAVALGACVIEKHFILKRAQGGPDSGFSLEPAEFRRMVDAVRVVEQALGAVRYGVKGEEDKNLVFRRSLFAVADVRSGERFTPQNVRIIRPGYGLHPRHLDEVLGKKATRDIPRGTPLAWELVGSS
jgi:N-acetylneuraminate synthase